MVSLKRKRNFVWSMTLSFVFENIFIHLKAKNMIQWYWLLHGHKVESWDSLKEKKYIYYYNYGLCQTNLFIVKISIPSIQT
jgi:hypothetical protein